MSLELGMIAGEASGDKLGADLLTHLKAQHPELNASGIAGQLLKTTGCKSVIDMEQLSVMGLVEVLAHLPKLLKIRKHIIQYFLTNKPKLFLGIDYQEFNLSVAKALKQQGIKTAQYVGPSVWAWRSSRIYKLQQSIDLLLTLFPFEKAMYTNSGIRVEYVGHPLADQIPMQLDKITARTELNIKAKQVIALLPGSRGSEIKYLGELFLQTAAWLQQRNNNMEFVLPAVNNKRYAELAELIKQYPTIKVHLVQGQAQTAMAASDAILLASGTATLEAMLVKRPMVVAYRMQPITYQLLKRMVKLPNVALPNILANKSLVPEFIQAQATVDNLGQALLQQLEDEQAQQDLQQQFCYWHEQLRCDAAARAANFIWEFMQC